ncbi:unnamed protein product, partial [marine sediment metagenome]
AIPTDIDHAHTIDNADQKPPYYELAFLQAAAGAEIVDGIIIIWTDTIDSPNTIPAGWILQAGILDKYTRGCNGGYATAGSANHLHTVQPSATHNHGASISSTGTNHAHSAGYNTMPSHDHQIYTLSDIGGTSGVIQNDESDYHLHSANSVTGAHSHTIGAALAHTHTCEATNNDPKHRLVAFIEVSGATSVPNGGVLIWMTASPPANFAEVTELRGRLVRSVPDSTTNPDLVTDRGVDNHNHTEAGESGAHKFGTDPEDHA